MHYSCRYGGIRQYKKISPFFNDKNRELNIRDVVERVELKLNPMHYGEICTTTYISVLTNMMTKIQLTL